MTFKSGKIMNFKLGKSPLALAIVAAMLVGCGGGGSSSKPSTSTPPTNPTTPTDPTDPTTPTDPTDPTTPTDPTDPTKPVEKEPSVVDTNTTVAKVKVGVLDSGVVETESLKGSISSIKKYSFNTSTGEVTVTDLSNASANLQDNGNSKHGTFVSTIIAGSSVNGSAEGVANGVAEIYAAQTTENGIGTSYTKTFFFAANDQMMKNGVKLFNISSGSTWNRTDEEMIAVINQSGALDVVKNGGLLVFSSGNDGLNEPSSLALFPKFNAEIEKGWLVVTGLNEDHTELYRDDRGVGANACGVAAKWCLAADYVNSNLSNTALSDYLYSLHGTSGAAPQVTGTAALVWSNYPWMTADQVRQTLLTTADYMDDGSVNNGLYNETYGWGYFNKDKAVNGVGMFTKEFGDFDANVTDGYVGVFSNDIKGDAGLIKNGNGRLVLSGDNSYTGDTTVNSGVLKVSGDTSSSVFTVNGGGTLLGGNGTTGSVNNYGNVSTGEGTLAVKGDYTQSKDASLTYKVGNELTVSGKADIDGALNVTATAAKYVQTGTHTVLNADGGLTGQFSEVNTKSAFLTVGNTAYDSNNVYTDVGLKSASETASIKGGVSTASAQLTDKLLAKADELYKSGDTSNNLVNYAAQLQAITTADGVQAVLNSNSGSIFAETSSVLLKNQSLANGSIVRHLSDAGLDASGVWVDYTALTTKNGASGWDSVDSDVYSTSVGVDFTLNDNALIGGYVSQLKDKSEYSLNANKAETDLTGFGVYGKYLFSDAYMLGTLHYGLGDTEYSRNVNSGLSTEQSVIKSDTSVLNSYVEAGRNFNMKTGSGSLDVTPFFAASYASVKTDGLSERLTTGLKVSDSDAEEFGLHAGLRLTNTFSNGFALGGFAQYTNIVDRDLSKVSVASNLDNDISVDFTPPDFDKDYFIYGLNAKYETPMSKWVLFGNAFAVSDDNSGYLGQVGFKYNF